MIVIEDTRFALSPRVHLGLRLGYLRRAGYSGFAVGVVLGGMVERDRAQKRESTDKRSQKEAREKSRRKQEGQQGRERKERN